jgi:hypothetical protein
MLALYACIGIPISMIYVQRRDPNIGIITAFMITIFFCGAAFWPFMLWEMVTEKRLK